MCFSAWKFKTVMLTLVSLSVKLQFTHSPPASTFWTKHALFKLSVGALNYSSTVQRQIKVVFATIQDVTWRWKKHFSLYSILWCLYPSLTQVCAKITMKFTGVYTASRGSSANSCKSRAGMIKSGLIQFSWYLPPYLVVKLAREDKNHFCWTVIRSPSIIRRLSLLKKSGLGDLYWKHNSVDEFESKCFRFLSPVRGKKELGGHPRPYVWSGCDKGHQLCILVREWISQACPLPFLPTELSREKVTEEY